MKIKCFGISKEIIGQDQLELQEELNTIGDVREYLNLHYPELKKIHTYMLAKNLEYGEDSETLSSADEIAIIPPVSGG